MGLGISAMAWTLAMQDPGTTPAGAAQRKKGQNAGKGGGRVYPMAKSAWDVASVLLGAPTDKSIAMTIHPRKDLEAFLEYGPKGGKQVKSEPKTYRAGVPSQLALVGLKADTAYGYRMHFKFTGEPDFATGPEYSFHTQRKAGSSFSFLVQGDSHPERLNKMNVPELYERVLNSAVKQKSDFMICMGDDFSIDTMAEHNQKSIEGAYTKQVPYLGLVGNSAPIFLVNGNHEQAAKVNLNGTPDSVGVWTQTARNRNFSQPAPDGFYTGNSEEVKHIGLLRDYFAWTWGDATFVVIDPYWHSEVAVDNTLSGGNKRRDLWDITLGDKQYQWLKKTLSESKAKYKFVFAHHVHGTSRGGTDIAHLYEWGGKDQRGVNVFAQKRPNWDLTIQQIFEKYGVSIFFQGHDHIFVKQELNGVIYQSTPVPADSSNPLYNADAYRTGDKVSGAGLLKVSISPEKAKVEFLRSYLPAQEVDGKKHFETAYSYEVTPKEKTNEK